MSASHPPRWLERILERAVPDGLSGQGTVGDLAEGWARRARASRLRAGVWYARQVGSVVVYRLLTGSGTDSARSDSDLRSDLRWAIRLVLRHPGFAAAVVAVLGLGLGANAAVFSVVDGTFRNTSWWSEPDRTVRVWPERELSHGMLDLYAREQAAYRSIGGYVELAFSLRSPDGESQSVNGVLITPELFRELAVQPVTGRALADDDALLGVEPVVVLGHDLWRRTFGGDPDLVGRTVDLGGRGATVVGIQGPAGRAPGGRAELWMPAVGDPREDDYFRAQNLTAVGVLEDGATSSDAHAELVAFTERLSSMFPRFFPPGFAEGRVSVARADETQRRLVSTPLLLLMGSTALLLFVTALNVGSLLLGRAIERRRELAIRAAIGAGRGRILRQLLVEGAVLTFPAIAIALGCAALGGPALAGLFVGQAVVVSSGAISPAVLLVALGSGVLAWGVLCGVPAAYFLRTGRRGPRMAAARSAFVQRGLVTGQAALATLLLVSATLLVGTVDNLRRVPLGFDERGLVSVELSPPEDRVATVPRARDLYDRLAGRVGAIPGVEAVGLTAWLPLRAEAPPTPVNVRDDPKDPAQAVTAPMHLVDPGFFRAMGVRASAGRLLGSEEREPRPSGVVVNETLARLLWPDGGAVGRSIAIDPHAWSRWVPVVGVVPDIRSGEITGPTQPALYVALAESPARDVTLVVRVGGGSAAIPAIRDAVREVDPLVPVRSAATMIDVVRSAYAIAWVVMGLLVVMAALATGLGALGIYAVLAHHVAARRRELGVRMALGAEPGDLVRSVVRSGLVVAGSGVLIGAVAAAGASRVLESMLFGVTTLSPGAYVVSAIGLLVAAALAAWIPASRAGRLPPAEALRSD